MSEREDFFRLSERVRGLEGWQRDVAGELREMRDDLQEFAPFVRQMREEEEYRRRKIAEAAEKEHVSDRRFSRAQIVWGAIIGGLALGMQAAGIVLSIRAH